MRRFRILLAADSRGGGGTLNRGVTWAETNRVRLTVIEVIERMPCNMGMPRTLI
jgi:hypothetical protein